MSGLQRVASSLTPTISKLKRDAVVYLASVVLATILLMPVVVAIIHRAQGLSRVAE